MMRAHRYADEISPRALARARRQVAQRGTPRVIQALPLPSVHEATRRPSCLPSLIVGGLVLSLAFLEQAVPTIAGVIAAVLP